jgi:hypothetical protein
LTLISKNEVQTYEITAPAPEKIRGWYWEIMSTGETGGWYYSSAQAMAKGRARVDEINKANS